MATRTATQSGLWSDTATWGGAAIPVNGDAVVINTGVTVTFDVDQSGFANGLLSLQIDGKLTFKPDTNTCLKMNGNITGTGELWVGTEENPIQRPTAGSEYRAYLLFNSTGTINVPTIRMYGWYPEREYTQLSADASVGQNQIVLQEDLGLQAGDMIIIESGTELGPTVETAGGLYTVQSYDSGTKTVNLSVNLGTNRLNGDYVAICSRPIKLKRSSGTTRFLVVTSQIDNVINVGVCYDGCALYAASTSGTYPNKDYIFKHCSNRGAFITNAVYNLSAEYITFKGYYPFSYCSDSKIDNIIGIGSGISAGYGLDMIINNGINFNGSFLGSGVIKDSLFRNISIIRSSPPSLYINCIIHSDVAYDPISNTSEQRGTREYINCVFKPNNGNGYFKVSQSICHNCLFEEIKEVADESIRRGRVLKQVESFDHNQISGNYKAWMKGGRIETDFDGETCLPSRLIFNCESDDYPVFREYQVQLPQSRTMRWQALANKSFTGGIVRMELIDPIADPLIDSSAQPLASYSLPDQAGTNLPLKLGYKSPVPMQAILRISAQNATGTVEIDTRLIENRVQHGR